MGVVRRWVFPIVWMVIVAVGVAALAKIAFFPDSPTEVDPAAPTVVLTEPTVVVGRGSITNDLTLTGTVAADPAVPVKATAAGTVDDVYLEQGAVVAKGDLIYDIRVETPQEPVDTVNPDGTTTTTQPKPVVRFERIYAPADGVLSALSVIPDQSVTVGDTTGQVAPPSSSVTGSIESAQLYRIQNRPTEAQVTIPQGPAPFTCTGLTITTPLAGAGTSAGATDEVPGGTGGSGTSFRCAVPPEVTVFPGLSASVVLAGGKADDVLVVPTTAVKGTTQTGIVYVQGEDGTSTEVPVTLGLTDGANVEITGGIEEGATILQFVPGADAGTTDPMMGGGGFAEECVALDDGSFSC